MSRYTLTIALVILSACVALAQDSRTGAAANVTNSTTASANGKAINLESGTRLAAQLQNTLDVRKAKVGDQVVLKTTEAIKSQGRTVVGKGARLIGHVTSVGQKGKAGGESSLSLVFDKLESGALAVPINATITSVTRAVTHANVGNDDLSSDTGVRATTTARTSSRQSSGSNGGLLGGVTGTVGNVVNSTTQTAGDVVGGTTNAAGSTVNGVARSVGGIRISESTDASVEGGSTLSLTGDNLRLEKGTAFNLRLNQAASVGARDQ
jgi:hypothetical protein